MMTANDMRLEQLFNELVPPSGKADSLAGEIVRATMRISYRNFNDGDRIGVGYGRETCNPPARFLLMKAPPEITGLVRALWGMKSDTGYEAVLDAMIGLVADYIESHPELREQPTDDMFDYRDPDEDTDVFWDDYEDDDSYDEAHCL